MTLLGIAWVGGSGVQAAGCSRFYPSNSFHKSIFLYIGRNNTIPHTWGFASGPGGIRTLGFFSAIDKKVKE
jgi:hypothetical protein